MRNVITLVLVALLVGGSSLACAQSAGEDDAERERLLENLKLEIPQLRQAASITLGPREESSVPGFEQATLTIDERNTLPVLVREDGEQVLILAAPPVDASRSLDAVQAEQAAEASEQQAMLDELVGDAPVRGAADAPVTMVAFSDFQCPYCAESTALIDAVLDRYDGRVKFAFLHYPLPNHDWAKPAAIAAECAAQQDEDAFWTLHDAYFARQGDLTEENVVDETAALLEGVDLDLETWRTCATGTASEAHAEAQQAVETAMQGGEQLGVRGTPTFFIDGELMQGPRSVESFGARIEEAAAAD